MGLWGFRHQLGRIWAVLFLSERPLAAPDLCGRLGISTGLLSMSLRELRRWGVVRGVAVAGDRKEHYQAETDVWRMVRRVLAEREKRAVEQALAVFEAALADARVALRDVDPRVERAARHRVQRLSQLVALTRGAVGILRALLEAARLDLAPIRAITEVLSGRGARRQWTLAGPEERNPT